MRTAGIICEYNPLHLGHVKQFAQLRAALGPETAIVCAMSGNFVQRGEPAVFEKMTRAAAAVDCGADLVVELPLSAVLCSAEGFARGGVAALDALGAETLAFGCESGETAEFLRLAAAMDTADYQAALRTALAGGLSYPAAREAAANALHLPGQLLQTPNNILALEYCRAALGRRIRPLALRREGDYHAALPDRENPSATAVRALLSRGGDWQSCVPEAARARFAAAQRFSLCAGERAMLARLRGLTEAEWQRTAHGSEGLWSLARRAALDCGSLAALEAAVKSKRYPMTRVRRLLLCAYLGLTAEDLLRPLPYLRVLALNETGRRLLRTARETCPLPLINAGQRPPDADYFALECRAAALHGLFCEGPDISSGRQEQENRVYCKK